MKYTYSHNNLIIKYKGKDKKGIPLIRTEELHVFLPSEWLPYAQKCIHNGSRDDGVTKIQMSI